MPRHTKNSTMGRISEKVYTLRKTANKRSKWPSRKKLEMMGKMFINMMKYRESSEDRTVEEVGRLIGVDLTNMGRYVLDVGILSELEEELGYAPIFPWSGDFLVEKALSEIRKLKVNLEFVNARIDKHREKCDGDFYEPLPIDY